MEQFTPEERRIFQYHNGLKPVFGDPLEIFDTMTHLLGCHPNQAKARIGRIVVEGEDYRVEGEIGLPALEALRKFCEAINISFEMVPFDKETGIGSTRSHQLEAWQALCDYLKKKSKSTGLWPTNSPPIISGQARSA